MSHLTSHVHHPELRSDNTLHVVGVVSNPVRFNARYRLARKWLDEMNATPNVRAYLVETAFGDREHECAVNGADDHLRLRTKTEAWIKESMVNLGVRYLLPRDWRYMAWVDADVHFRDRGWALETLHQLQHWPVVQPWQSCADLGPTGEIVMASRSFGFVHQQRAPKQNRGKRGAPYAHAHPGYAWACTRTFWEQVGGLLDFCILGSADQHMAWAMIGDAGWTVDPKLATSYRRRVLEWQTRAVKVTRREVGFASGRIEHGFHGAKANRQYRSRWQVLIEHGYDPDKDLMHDEQGLVRLAGKPRLEQAIRMYNRARNEDSIDV